MIICEGSVNQNATPLLIGRRSSTHDGFLPSFLLFEAMSLSVFIILGVLLSGCAVYYRDRDTGAEHIFGFGHLSVKALPPHDGKQAIVQRMTLIGIAAGLDNGALGMSAGWDRREHILIYDENAAVTIQRPPSNDFFYFKIGTYPPEREKTPDTANGIDTKESLP
jgi:hypothetical protein